MRRPSLLLAVLVALSASAAAQSTARPLPAFGLGSPISAATAGLGRVSLTSTTTSTERSGGFVEASAPTPWDQAAWKPVDLGRGPEAEAAASEDFSSLELFAIARGEADFMDTAGSLAVQRAGFDATLGKRSVGRRAFALHLANESSFYEFGSSSSLVPGASKPFNDLYRTSAGVQLAVQAAPNWAWLAGAELTMAGEDLVDPTDSLQLGGLGGVRYDIADDVSFSFGLAGQSRLEDDAWVMPFFGLDWRMSDSTRFRVHGSELRLEQDLGSKLRLHAGAIYDIRDFRLNDENPVSGGVFRDEEIRVSAGLDWQVSESGRLGLEVGQVMWNELSVLDAGGAQVGLTEAEKAPFVGFSLTFGL